MNDTHTILNKAHSHDFTDYLNQVDDDIKWMMEGEVIIEVQVDQEVEMAQGTERSLAFLDTNTVVEINGSTRTKVFRKETDINQYLHFSCNHSLEHTKEVVKHCYARLIAL